MRNCLKKSRPIFTSFAKRYSSDIPTGHIHVEETVSSKYQNKIYTSEGLNIFSDLSLAKGGC